MILLFFFYLPFLFLLHLPRFFVYVLELDIDSSRHFFECPDGLAKEGKKENGQWTDIYIIHVQSRVSKSGARRKEITFWKTPEIFRKNSADQWDFVWHTTGRRIHAYTAKVRYLKYPIFVARIELRPAMLRARLFLH